LDKPTIIEYFNVIEGEPHLTKSILSENAGGVNKEIWLFGLYCGKRFAGLQLREPAAGLRSAGAQPLWIVAPYRAGAWFHGAVLSLTAVFVHNQSGLM